MDVLFDYFIEQLEKKLIPQNSHLKHTKYKMTTTEQLFARFQEIERDPIFQDGSMIGDSSQQEMFTNLEDEHDEILEEIGSIVCSHGHHVCSCICWGEVAIDLEPQEYRSWQDQHFKKLNCGCQQSLNGAYHAAYYDVCPLAVKNLKH